MAQRRQTYPLGTYVSYQLVACWLHPGIGFLPVHQEHVFVVESVKFEVTTAAHVVLPVRNAKMIVEFFRGYERHQTGATFQRLRIVVMNHVLLTLLLGGIRFQTDVAQEIHLDLRRETLR